MNEIGRGGSWENDVKSIVTDVLNGGEKCAKGKIHDTQIKTLEDTVENMDTNIFPRLFDAIGKVKEDLGNKLLAIAGAVILQLLAFIGIVFVWFLSKH
jgi:hypothetical protein